MDFPRTHGGLRPISDRAVPSLLLGNKNSFLHATSGKNVIPEGGKKNKIPSTPIRTMHKDKVKLQNIVSPRRVVFLPLLLEAMSTGCEFDAILHGEQ